MAAVPARILIVDDMPQNIHVLSAILRSEGYILHVALTGSQALKVAREVVPDLILLDLVMPGMDGYEVCRRLKEHPATAHIPVIIVTARGEEENEAKGLELGAADFLTKPVSPLIVKARVHSQLELMRRHTRARIQELAIRLQEARETERKWLAREVHDDLGSRLAKLKMDAIWLRRHLKGHGAAITSHLDGMIGLIGETIAGMRQLVSHLRPVVLDQVGLAAALSEEVEDFGRRHGLVCSLECRVSDLPRDGDRETAIFRICQEALTNVARHARAGRVAVTLAWEREAVVLTVHDDGEGIPVANLTGTGGVGILGMSERAGQFGGTLHVASAPGQGTTVLASLPWPAAEDREEAP